MAKCIIGDLLINRKVFQPDEISLGATKFILVVTISTMSGYAEAHNWLSWVSLLVGKPADALTLIALDNKSRVLDLLRSFEVDTDLFASGLINAALGYQELAFEYLEQMNYWDCWPVLAMRYFYRDIWSGLEDKLRLGRLLDSMNDSWGLA